MKKCPKCSLNHEDSVMICTYCGHNFAEDEAPATEVLNTEEPAPAPEAAAEAPVQPQQPTNQGYQQTPPPPPYNQQSYNPYGAPQGKYCPRCGNLCDPNAVICVKCGMSFGPMPQQSFGEDKASTGFKILCFFFPIVALILYIVEKDKKPNAAKEYGKWGIIGLAVNVGLSIISSIATALIGFANVSYYDDMYFYSIFLNFFN